jgi:tRNA(Ile)-lysidine synthase
MSLLKRFTGYINEQNLFQKKDYLLLAVSGGVDSIVLCELCRQAGFNFEIAHCNFQLRGEESERDEYFVQSLGSKYHTTIFIKKFDTGKYAAENKVSIQVAARELRYQWFNELIASTGNRQPATGDHPQTSHILHRTSYILTAHHANDNIETLLMNFFKGTGIKGLRGILPKQDKVIRPLLFAKKADMLSFAHENNLSFVEDSSNSSDKYSRNYFRNQLIPFVQKLFPQAEENLLNNIERFKEIDVLYRQALHLHKKKLIEHKGYEVHIPVLKLLKTQPLKTIVYEIIKDYGFTAHQTEEVLHLLNSESGKYISSATHKIIKNRKWMIIAPHNNLEASLIVINEKDKEIEFEMGKLKIEKYTNVAGYQPSTDNYTATLDANAITFPLLLRKWKQGDYFYPLGMRNLSAGRHGKKKLSRFFIDQKMSLAEKERTWVIESEKKIIWILGKRIDDRFKITDRTNSIIKIHFSEL